MIEEEKTMTEKKEKATRTLEVEKVVLSIGGTGDTLERGMKLLKLLTGKKPTKTESRKRIPSFAVRPGLETGVMITIRKNPEEILKKMLMAIDNVLKKKQISENNFSFGIKEYLEIPGVEYQRDVGILGLDVTVVFKVIGKRVKLKKIKKGKLPKRQRVSKQEIIKFMEDKFQTSFVGK